MKVGDKVEILSTGFKVSGLGNNLWTGNIKIIKEFDYNERENHYIIRFTDGTGGHGNINDGSGDSLYYCLKLVNQELDYEVY